MITAALRSTRHIEPASAGWYGKLPSLGDFASRRLPPGFIEAWDGWLAEELAAWRAREPATWLQRYLHSPSWRFVLAPGVLPAPLGTAAWAGVLMPSVDRVGRYFPLTLAWPQPTLPQSLAQARALLSWLQSLNDLALDALDEDWDAETLDAALQHLGGPAPPQADATAPDEDTLAAALLALPADAVCWLHADALGALHGQHSQGLPRGAAFEALVGHAPPR